MQSSEASGPWQDLPRWWSSPVRAYPLPRCRSGTTGSRKSCVSTPPSCSAAGRRRWRCATPDRQLDRYASHEFLNMYAVELDHTSGGLGLSGLSAFITPTSFVAVRTDTAFDMQEAVARWDDQPDLAG